MRKRVLEVSRDHLTSPCGDYTYELARSWGPGDELRWVLLHPGPEFRHEDSPATAAVIRHSRRLGYGSARIAYLYPLRCLPGELWREESDDQLGEGVLEVAHDLFMRAWLSAAPAVAAWGTIAPQERARLLHSMAPEGMLRLEGGSDRHPPDPTSGHGSLVQLTRQWQTT